MAASTFSVGGASNSNFSAEKIRWDIIQDVAARCSQGKRIDVLDLSDATHLRPYIVALCVGVCRLLGADRLHVVWPDARDAADHLARLRMPEVLGTDGPTVDSRSTNIPLEVLSDRPSDEFSWSLVDLLEREFGDLGPGDKPDICDSIDEIILNALTHSASPIGGVVAAQAFPVSRRIEAVILDLGVTIRGHLGRMYEDLQDDASAIHRAVEDGITGTDGLNRFGEPNSGAGLNFVRAYLEEARGELAILSGDSVVTFSDEVRDHRLRGVPFPGTLVNLCFNLA